MNHPNISVIVPVYNTPAQAINTAFASLVTQRRTFQNFDVVVIDDGSTDAQTLATISQWQTTLSTGWFRFIRLDKNVGQAEARNIGAISTRSPLLAFLDSDDAYFSSSLLVRATVLERGGFDMVWSSFIYRMMHRSGQEVGTSAVRKDLLCKECTAAYTKEMASGILQRRNITTPLTVMMRRSTFIECGGFETGLVCSEDWLLWRRVMDRPSTSVKFIDEPTGYYQAWDNLKGQSRELHEPEGGFHLDVNHPMGRAGEYLDTKARWRAESWKEHL